MLDGNDDYLKVLTNSNITEIIFDHIYFDTCVYNYIFYDNSII